MLKSKRLELTKVAYCIQWAKFFGAESQNEKTDGKTSDTA